MIALIYRAVKGWRKREKEARDNAIVRGVFMVLGYIHERGDKETSGGGRIPRRQAGSQTGGETGTGNGERGDVDWGVCAGEAVWD